MVAYLVNVGGPVSLVLDLHIFIPTIVSTSVRLDNEFVCLSFLQSHRETDHVFATSGNHLV